jgi:VWFA-related protein
MRLLVALVFLSPAWMPAFASRQVTVQEVEQLLGHDHGKRDAELAKELSDLQLTERVSPARLSKWEAEFSGSKIHQTLIALADASAFLDLPVVDIPSKAAPDFATQRQIMARTVEYVGKTIHRLPNFFATRKTTRFQDIPVGYREELAYTSVYQPLRVIGRSSATVLIRDGKEVVDRGSDKGKNPSPLMHTLTTEGEFGSILATVIIDASRGTLGWSHWEQGTNGTVAVFRYAVPQPKSQYEVKWCCTAEIKGFSAYLHLFHSFTGYHGEIAVDPAGGSILRLTLVADLKPTDPISRASIEVEYGPVDIGGQSYICPVKSIAVSHEPAQIYLHLRDSAERATDPQMTSLNDVAYGQYHLFRSESRILMGDAENPARTPATSAGLPAPQPGESTNGSGEGSKDTVAIVPLPAGRPAEPASVVDLPGISVAETTGLPDSSMPSETDPGEIDLVAAGATEPVMVSVMAFDKDGHPVTNLARDDFAVYDEGEKVQIVSFNGPSERGVLQSPATILLFDAGSLTSAEIEDSRAQISQFLKNLPAGERIGLYILTDRALQVLLEPSSDKRLLLDAWDQWVPSAPASKLESTRDQSVSAQTASAIGKSGSEPEAGNPTQVSDGSLPVNRHLSDAGNGQSPDRSSSLLEAARHLAAIPGQKGLAWITSGAIEGNWRENSERISGKIDDAFLDEQDALNEANVVVFPLTPWPSQSAAGDRSATLAARLDDVVTDGSAAYQLSFVPDMPGDDRYHRLMVQLSSPHDLALRYRRGYFYDREPTTFKEKLEQAFWQVNDKEQVALTATTKSIPGGVSLRLNVSAAGLGIVEQGGVRTDKLDVFVAQRDCTGLHATVRGQTLSLQLAPATYEKILDKGIPVDEPLEIGPDTDSIRVVVADENTGHIGSVTLLPSALQIKQ